MIYIEIATILGLAAWFLYRHILPIKEQIDEIERKQKSYFEFRKKQDETLDQESVVTRKELIRMSTLFSSDVDALADSIESITARIKELEGKK